MTGAQDIFAFIQQTAFYKAGLFFLIFLGIVFWFAMVVWVMKDAERHFNSRAKVVFATFLPLFLFLFGFLFYFILRPAKTPEEKMYERYLRNAIAIQENPSTCPFCSGAVKKEHIFCPHCGRKIRRKCFQCGEYVRVDWDFCPFCGQNLK